MLFGGGILDGLFGQSQTEQLWQGQSAQPESGGLLDVLQSPQMALAAQLMNAPRVDQRGFATSGMQQIGSALAGFQQEMRQRRQDKLEEQKIALGEEQSIPANIREWQKFEAMTPDEKREYLTMKRATQMLDLGNQIVPFDPLSASAPQPAPQQPVGGMAPNEAAMMKELYPDEFGGIMGGQPQTGTGLLTSGYMKQPPPQEMPEFKAQQEREKAKGKASGEAEALLGDIESNMPNINNVVVKLDKLADAASYTQIDKFDATLKRQLGVDVGSAADAKAEYISTVDNEILPLLRQTFGAQFTENEGKALRATLGDPDASPSEKKAKLRAFIDAKIGQVQSLQRRTGQQVSPKEEISTYGQGSPAIDELKSKYGLE